MSVEQQPQPARKILALDVCGTLFDANTTAGFVRHHFAGKSARPTRFAWLEMLRMPGLRLGMIALGKLTGRDYFRRGYIACLAGVSRADLEASARSYADHLDSLRIAPVWQEIAQFRADGFAPVLASNSLDIVIAAIGARLGWDNFASQLAFDGAICTGELARDLKGAKARRLHEYLGQSGEEAEIAVITDNRSDGDLIAMADTALLVSAGTAKRWMHEHDARIIHH